MITRIKEAIQKATGQTFESYNTKSRKLKFFYPRMIFAYKCHESGMLKIRISEALNQNWATVHHLINRYNDEIMTNGEFRLMAYHVNFYLNQNERT